jgi:hypothetical protein
LAFAPIGFLMIWTSKSLADPVDIALWLIGCWRLFTVDKYMN